MAHPNCCEGTDERAMNQVLQEESEKRGCNPNQSHVSLGIRVLRAAKGNNSAICYLSTLHSKPTEDDSKLSSIVRLPATSGTYCGGFCVSKGLLSRREFRFAWMYKPLVFIPHGATSVKPWRIPWNYTPLSWWRIYFRASGLPKRWPQLHSFSRAAPHFMAMVLNSLQENITTW